MKESHNKGQAIRKRFGKKARIIVRGDSGFAREEIFAWCEEHGVYYCTGLARNERLQGQLEATFEALRQRIEAGEVAMPCRQFVEFEYRTLKSWSRERRVIGKAEVLEKGENPRFVVTNLPKEGFAGDLSGRLEAAALYEKFYCARGEMENRIKEAQQDLLCGSHQHWVDGLQPAAAMVFSLCHLMLSVLRAEVLRGTELAGATLGTIRLKLFKIAARIKVSCRRIHFELASGYPYLELFAQAHRQLGVLQASG